MKIIKSQIELDGLRQESPSLSLVPTMGALHAGHMALVEKGLQYADVCMPYIFVNPTQFAEGEDLDTYPRTLDADLEKLEQAGVQAVWLPSIEDVYPNGPEISVRLDGITKVLEGEYRPHFFDGVTTVLDRMFYLSKPDFVMMGEKDFQQLQVVKKMVRDLKLPVEIIGVETSRDKNGLALSSRNLYLSESECEIAIHFNKILRELAHGVLDEERAHEKLLSVGFDKIDYCTVRNAETLTKEGPLNRVLAAVWLGRTRLIDNMPINV